MYNLFRPLFLGLAVWLPQLSLAGQDVSWLRTKNDCTEFISVTAYRICDLVMRSRMMLDHEHPRLIRSKNGRVEGRQIAIVAWSADDTPHTIWLTTPLRPKKGEEFKVTTVTPGYTIERIRGTGPYKIQFRVWKSDVELKVFGGKHVWIPQGYDGEMTFEKLSRVAEERQYLPFQDHLFHDELVLHGKYYLETLIDEARRELVNVPSKAFSGFGLKDAYPREMILNLIVSEHTDPFKLFDEKVIVGLSREKYLLGTLIEIALHGQNAFAELCSTAPACGWTQFTNKAIPAKKWPGTYTYTYNQCRDLGNKPVILANFKEGTRDAKNAVKAAICYLDLENAALPMEAREEFRTDPKQGSVYMLAAYNAGGGWSRQLFKSVQTLRVKLAGEPPPLHYESLPRLLFERGKFYNLETHWYIRKYLWTWHILYPHREIKILDEVGK
jgi:hypothetical protein